MIDVVTLATAHYFGDALASQARLRYRMFVACRNIEHAHFDGMEYDRFDTPSAVYLLWRDAGGGPADHDQVHAFVELHIEQGPVLDRRGAAIGVVEGIVGLQRWEVSLIGQANHAGTTPMDLRRDAFAGLAEFGGDGGREQLEKINHPVTEAKKAVIIAQIAPPSKMPAAIPASVATPIFLERSIF